MIDETICAPSTPPVHSSIAIVRVSGPESFRAVGSFFSAPEQLKPRYACYGTLAEDGEPIDDVILVWYRAPQSYTGEEMAEIFCHGNPIIVQKIIGALNRRGVRLAEPGEFTKRAFLNGKIDLTEAEAINHIITARSEWEIETSLRQMHGSLRALIRTIRDSVIVLKADIEAAIDFSDEEIEFISNEEAVRSADGIRGALGDLLGRCRTGERLSRGIDVAITGKPNVGKSSVLNLLLNQERAIVSSIPGTTRDIIREPVQIGGVQINLNDTAGIDTPGDELERIGIDLSHRTIETSGFIILVLDASDGIGAADRVLLEKTRDKKRIVLANKCDIATPGQIGSIRLEGGERAILFSAVTGEGLDNLKEALSRTIREEFVDVKHSFIADMRIVSLLEKSIASIESALRCMANREPVEIIAFELQSLIETLSEITGEITPDDVLDSIFSRFCIGK
jgi:tRNA modification GTPase